MVAGTEARPGSMGVERVKRSRVGTIDFANVGFSTVFSDHMFSAEFRDGNWSGGEIKPYGPLLLEPSISALHYGVSTFEGTKAHRAPNGKPLLFRIRENARRLQRSAARLAMAVPPEALFVNGLRELIRLDQAWVPPAGVGALYIRPLLFSTDPSIRVKPAEQFQLLIFTFPYGSYYSAPVDVVVTEKYVRAFPGGTGDTKPSGNYAPSLLADLEAREAGFHSTMWLDAQERRYVEECGVMNVFFVIGDDVVTPSLSGSILPGITRDSVITLARDMGYTVREEPVAIEDLFVAHEKGLLRECFGTGTAATLSHIGRIRYRNRTIELPPAEGRIIGPALRQRLIGLMTGIGDDPYGWTEEIDVTHTGSAK